MMRDVFLYGVAGRVAGRRHFRLDVTTPAEAVRALLMLRPALKRTIREGLWRVVVGPPRLRYAVAAEHLLMNAGQQPIHLVPATPPRGGGSGKAFGAIIVGVLLIGAAIAFPATIGAAAALVGMTQGSVVLLGASMVLTGMMGLLAQPPQPDQATDQARPDDRPSFLFNGVTNNSQQGGPVPLIFGTHLTGSVVVNAGLNAEDIA